MSKGDSGTQSILARLRTCRVFESVRPAKISVGFLTLLWAVHAWSYPEVRFQRLTMADGLSQSAIQAIAQDHQGYIWIGTQYGLDRYDGYEFKHFRHDPEDPNSLSNSNIASLLVARTGKLWVLTKDGLNRMDPVTGTVKRIKPANESSGRTLSGSSNRSMVEDTIGNIVIPASRGIYLWEAEAARLKKLTFSPPLPDSRLHGSNRIVLDRQQRFWLANSAGLWVLDRHNRRFERILPSAVDESTRHTHTLTRTSKGLMAFASLEGLYLIDSEYERIVDHIRPSQHGHATDRVHAVAAASDDSLWLLLPKSLVRINSETGQWEAETSLPTYGQADSISRQSLYQVEDANGYHWLSGHFGVAIHDPDNGNLSIHRHEPGRPDSLTPTTTDSGYQLFADRNGTIWVGSGLGGISRFIPQSARFQRIREQSDNPTLGGENIVRAVLEQSWEGQERLWSGLDGAGLCLWQRDPAGRYHPVRKYHRRAESEFRLPDNEVNTIVEHPDNGTIWVGTGEGLAVIEPDQGLVQQDIDFDSEIPDAINALLFSSDGKTLWAASRDRVYGFATEDGRQISSLEWRHKVHPDRQWDNSYLIFDLLETRSGDLLIATRMGLSILTRDGNDPIHIFPGPVEREHPRNYIFSLAEYPENTYWLGTRQGGLGRLKLDQSSGREPDPEFKWYLKHDGLADNTIYAILPDSSGRLWLSSNSGLMNLDPETGRTRQYTHRDGLQDLEFNHTVAHAGPSGHYYFGGISGINAFRPDTIEDHPDPPRIYLQQVSINGNTRHPSAGGTPRLELSHDENYLVIDYVGLHYVDPERIDYAYRLDGLESEWAQVGNRRQARYPELPPGEYEFVVRAANSDGIWSDDRVLLTATVKPPPWMSPKAYIAYAALAGLLILFAIAMHFRRRLALEALVDQRTAELAEKTRLVEQQARELEEALEARTTLFANISHEFRTPITLIQGALERLKDQGADPATLATGRRYLNRLVRLVDQLLDLSRLRTRRHRPTTKPWPLDQIVAMTTEAFRPPASQKDIDIHTRIEGHWQTRCEQELVEKILLNLLSNAVKFTPEEGQITVTLERRDDNANQVSLAISDTGPGISGDEQEQIFERFHRTEAAENLRIQGAGIGLTLVREAVQALGGTIELESEPGYETTFLVTLPAWQDEPQASDPELLSKDSLGVDLETLEAPDEPAPQVTSPQKPAGTVLIVEDNSDLRAYIREIIANEWKVIEAGDGHHALKQALQHAPDLVISDIMMPDMDGLDLLKALREDIRTSHLPVLLLTARQDNETRIKAFSIGADNYLTKPFDAEELRLRLRQMAERRQHLQAAIRRKQFYRQQTDQTAPDTEAHSNHQSPELTQRDQQFLDSLEKWLHRHHTNPEVGVKNMADAMNMDTRTLQRKLRALTGASPAIHLRDYRLQCAETQLKNTNRTIQDIATACGFSSAQYFSRIFRQSHGTSPQAWRRLR